MAEPQNFEQNGFAIVPNILGQSDCKALAAYFESTADQRAGTRNLLNEQWCQTLAASLKRHAAIAALLPPNPMAIQCTYFEKSSDKNWLVAFHQDLSIPVQEKISHLMYSGWSEKEGVIYTQPPVEVLDQMVAVRVHLDECGPRNGPLRVISGSHTYGRIMDNEIDSKKQLGEIVCCVSQGGVLVMRPLLLHASSKASTSSFRRVLHFLFAPATPPEGLRWHHAI
jgi:hypothetical protein